MKEAMIAGFISAHLKLESDFLLELKLKREIILAALVSQINKDVVSKMEQDVEIISVDLVDKNSLDITGRAGVMGIKKEFTIHSTVVHDRAQDLIALKVGDIEIQGGFLVKKGFSLIENTIREKIESSAKVELSKVIKNIKPKLAIPGSDQNIGINIEAFDLSTLELIPSGDEMLLRVKIDKADVMVKKEGVEA